MVTIFSYTALTSRFVPRYLQVPTALRAPAAASAGTVTYKTVIMFGHFVLFNVYNISGISKKHMMAVANDHGGLAFNMAHGVPIYSNLV